MECLNARIIKNKLGPLNLAAMGCRLAAVTRRLGAQGGRDRPLMCRLRRSMIKAWRCRIDSRIVFDESLSLTQQ